MTFQDEIVSLRIARLGLSKGLRVVHPDHGVGTVLSFKRNGEVKLKMDSDGVVGTAFVMSLRRVS